MKGRRAHRVASILQTSTTTDSAGKSEISSKFLIKLNRPWRGCQHVPATGLAGENWPIITTQALERHELGDPGRGDRVPFKH
jgi:hypothetical protein